MHLVSGSPSPKNPHWKEGEPIEIAIVYKPIVTYGETIGYFDLYLPDQEPIMELTPENLGEIIAQYLRDG